MFKDKRNWIHWGLCAAIGACISAIYINARTSGFEDFQRGLLNSLKAAAESEENNKEE